MTFTSALEKGAIARRNCNGTHQAVSQDSVVISHVLFPRRLRLLPVGLPRSQPAAVEVNKVTRSRGGGGEGGDPRQVAPLTSRMYLSPDPR